MLDSASSEKFLEKWFSDYERSEHGTLQICDAKKKRVSEIFSRLISFEEGYKAEPQDPLDSIAKQVSDMLVYREEYEEFKLQLCEILLILERLGGNSNSTSTSYLKRSNWLVRSAKAIYFTSENLKVHPTFLYEVVYIVIEVWGDYCIADSLREFG